MPISDFSDNQVSRKPGSAIDWLEYSQNWAYAFAKPDIKLGFKQSPEDFQVRELMPFSPQGEGEHWWLYIKKSRCHTVDVAKALARFVGVSYRDLAYSGLKDYFAETYQWFSIYKPKGDEPEWSQFDFPGAQIFEVGKHNKKLRRSSHRANAFKINLNCESISTDHQMRAQIDSKLVAIKNNGVPNYFGAQRFGRNMSNLNNAVEFFKKPRKGSKRLNDRQAMWVSAARAWLFNTVLAERVKCGNWNRLRPGEPCNLNTTHSYFVSHLEHDLEERLASGDIHPTAPMWGVLSPRDLDLLNAAKPCLNLEQQYLSRFADLKQGLENLHLPYKRRSTRSIPESVRWHFEENSLVLSFELLPGQYATSVLRELATLG